MDRQAHVGPVVRRVVSERRFHLTARDARGGIAARLVVLVAVLTLMSAAAVYVGQQADKADSPPRDPPLASGEPPVLTPRLNLLALPAVKPVLPSAEPGGSSRVSAPAVRNALGGTLSSSDLGKHIEFTVAQLGAPKPIVASRTPQTVTPASTLKLLTTTAALKSLGPDHRFLTSVVRGVDPDSLVLLGGGDPLLTDTRPSVSESSSAPQPAALEDLAKRVVRRLRPSGVRSVTLAYDDSLFSGPAINSTWEPSYVPESIVSPVGALWVDEGREDPDTAIRVSDPAAVAASRFAVLLDEQGLRVRGPVLRGRAPAHAPEVARVESASLAEIVEHTIENSDNEAAEVLLRHIALASGRPGSFEAGLKAMTSTLQQSDVDLAGTQIFDGSGLSRRSELPVAALVAVLQLTADPQHPRLRSVFSSLPVAGFNGSLADRFTTSAPSGLGLVRAKTGTLTGVHALAGTVMTRRGSVLLFAVVADQVPIRLTLAARAQLDRVATALSTCRC